MCYSRVSRTRLACATSILFGLLLVAGCDSGPRDRPLNKEAARQSLTAFLDCWKEGKSPDTLTSSTPAITGRDTDWEKGRSLVSYQLGTETDDGANSHITVDLELKGEGNPGKQTVTYIVSTSPAITIFRDE